MTTNPHRRTPMKQNAYISIVSAVVAALVASTAAADEPRIMWRSKSSGVLAVTAPVIPPPVSTFGVSYNKGRYTWRKGDTVSLIPEVRGSNGPLSWSIAVETPLPVGVTLNPITGVISGKAGSLGRYQVSIMITDELTGASVMAVAVMEVV